MSIETEEFNTERWNAVHASRQWGTCPEPAVARWAMRRWGGQVKDALGPLGEQIKPQDMVRILEVGCGVGAQAVWLGNHGFLVDGLDVEAAVSRAYQMMPNHLHHSIRFYSKTLPHLEPDCRNFYNGVVDVCCLQHVAALDDSLAEIKRVMKHGGQLFSIMATSCHSYDVLGEDLKGTTFHRLTIVELMRIYGAHFDVKAVESMNHTDRGKLISHWVVEAQK